MLNQHQMWKQTHVDFDAFETFLTVFISHFRSLLFSLLVSQVGTMARWYLMVLIECQTHNWRIPEFLKNFWIPEESLKNLWRIPEEFLKNPLRIITKESLKNKLFLTPIKYCILPVENKTILREFRTKNRWPKNFSRIMIRILIGTAVNFACYT